VKTIDEFLADHPFTKGLSKPHLELVAGCAKNVTLKPGTYAFREGDPADTFYVLRRGRVALEVFSPARGALTVQTVHDGEILGWSWLFPPYRCSFDARVVEATRAVAFDGACLRGKAQSDHELGYDLMTRMARVFTKRLTATRLQLLDLYGKSADR
jgi:CRP-like cAMP-binding protein